jgi:hypothetical protein
MLGNAAIIGIAVIAGLHAIHPRCDRGRSECGGYNTTAPEHALRCPCVVLVIFTVWRPDLGESTGNTGFDTGIHSGITAIGHRGLPE